MNTRSPAKIGLFFGSFNPIHVGHLIIANYMATQTDLKEVWMVVSPQNPLKQKQSLARDQDRLHLVRIAIDDNPKLRASDIEFSMPQPSYTIDTLTYLCERHPDKQFALIMGGDNLPTLPKWKNHDLILRDFEIYVYQRLGYELGELATHPQVKVFDQVPQMQISASYIRECLAADLPIQYLVTEPVLKYLESSGLYKKSRLKE
ncbi:MAG: nicotinate (nicotinamide) nucleotide adenylyltransferase [Haliscomenobacter sp.]|uniref:nicotinate (nicotinamide) nucleotide adenylyltransferase n=1 Tax=Haliscomenobacter sp. TaxID=2717303 RepID=UPI0029A6FDD2|nr:nicotinate (nicotinamide) nucleotide adenylyltransferase [Haliscomenobacter sp.]MDX2068242.1 nicotinate (nicotinamide) nucleotide adenylyltransferase [Haliscomenobacter sp.]